MLHITACNSYPQKNPLPNQMQLSKNHLDLRILFFPLLSLFFSLAASLFPNGNPLVLLSAPVLLLVRVGSCANSSVHTPKQNSAALPASPALKANVHPPTSCVYK